MTSSPEQQGNAEQTTQTREQQIATTWIPIIEKNFNEIDIMTMETLGDARKAMKPMEKKLTAMIEVVQDLIGNVGEDKKASLETILRQLQTYKGQNDDAILEVGKYAWAPGLTPLPQEHKEVFKTLKGEVRATLQAMYDVLQSIQSKDATGGKQARQESVPIQAASTESPAQQSKAAEGVSETQESVESSSISALQELQGEIEKSGTPMEKVSASILGWTMTLKTMMASSELFQPNSFLHFLVGMVDWLNDSLLSSIDDKKYPGLREKVLGTIKEGKDDVSDHPPEVTSLGEVYKSRWGEKVATSAKKYASKEYIYKEGAKGEKASGVTTIDDGYFLHLIAGDSHLHNKTWNKDLHKEKTFASNAPYTVMDQLGDKVDMYPSKGEVDVKEKQSEVLTYIKSLPVGSILAFGLKGKEQGMVVGEKYTLIRPGKEETMKDYIAGLVSGGGSVRLKAVVPRYLNGVGKYDAYAEKYKDAPINPKAFDKTLFEYNKVSSFTSPHSAGCADFVKYVYGLQPLRDSSNANQVEKEVYLADVGGLIIELQARGGKYITDPAEVQKYLKKHSNKPPEGTAIVYGNSYTPYNEDHIGIMANKSGSKVLMEYGGGKPRLNNPTFTTLVDASSGQLKKQQDAANKGSGVKGQPFINGLIVFEGM